MYEPTDRFQNWFITSLQTSVTDTTNSFRLNKALDVNQCRLVIDPYDEDLREIVEVTSVDGDLVYVNRGQDHTNAEYHLEGAIVALHVFAADMNDLYADWAEVSADMAAALADAEAATTAANDAAAAADTATDAANTATGLATTATTNANAATSAANDAASDANAAASDANAAASDANDAAADANQAVADVNAALVAGATLNAQTSVSGNGWVLDEDDMASNSDTKLATQQSIKKYINDMLKGTKSSSAYSGVVSGATSINTFRASRVGSVLALYITGTAASAWGDTTTTLCTVNLAALGCTLDASQQFVGGADGGNSAIIFQLSSDGTLYSVDSTIGRSGGIGSGDGWQFSTCINVTPT